MTGKLRCMTSLYLMRQDQFLLLYREGGRVVSQVWTSSAGGHFENHELNDPRACVLRELEEELGLREADLSGLEMKYITLRRTKGEIRVIYYFFAQLAELSRELHSNEGTLQWFPREALSGLEMPFTARHVVDHYLTLGKQDHALYCGVTNAQGVLFTPLPRS